LAGIEKQLSNDPVVDDNEELKRLVLQKVFDERKNIQERKEEVRKDYMSAFKWGEPYQLTDEIKELGLAKDFLEQRTNAEKNLKWNNFMTRCFGDDDD